MPFRLTITMVSLTLIVPAVIGGWSTVDYIQTEQRIRTEIIRVFAAAQRYVQAGSGGEMLEMNLRGGAYTRVEYLLLGDLSEGAYSRAARYKLSGGQEQVMIARNPSVDFHSSDGGRIKLQEGVHNLEIECIDGVGITVRLV